MKIKTIYLCILNIAFDNYLITPLEGIIIIFFDYGRDITDIKKKKSGHITDMI